jgi:uncharacterized protein (TIGR03435 family)
VAAVKLSDPNFKGNRFQIQPSGLVNIRVFTLKTLIQRAWGLEDGMVVGGPKWIDTDSFDIIARAPVADVPLAGNFDPLEIESVWQMVRALLTDRFKLATHMENRLVSAYTLTAVKPKLKKADPSNRTGCKYVSPPGGMICQNITMAEFVGRLYSFGHTLHPVLDATGIEGAWDFSLTFTFLDLSQGERGGNIYGMAPDPSAAVSIPEALNKQLGLKMELQKRPLPVLVIDHAEKPAEN